MKTTASRAGIPGTRYLFFGGKGGVGKTSCAASTALLLLEKAAPGDKILLFSTDPAHSLADSLDVTLGTDLTEVVSRNGASLHAWEMDAAAALVDFKKQHRATLETIADRGTLLDESDISGLLDLSLPGLDEVMALFELSEFDRHDTYTRIVVDTAPSGHTTRLLQLPEVFTRWIGALDRMSDKHRYMVRQLARRGRGAPDEVDAFLADLTERVGRVSRILRSAEKSSFVMVTIPELMAVEETSRYVKTVEDAPITDLVINRVESVHRSCKYCKARHAVQQPYLERIEKEFKKLRIHRVPLMPTEVRGIEGLRAFGELVWGTKKKLPVTAGIRGRTPNSANQEFGVRPSNPLQKSVYIIGGKGGVGKTTTAAAMAIALAEQHPDKRFLVFSTDPAHSLSDSFGEQIGPHKQGLAGLKNLDGIEVDAVRTFDELKSRYRKWIEEIFLALTGGSNWEVQYDREAMQELIALAPPGIDEIAALSRISDFLEAGTYTSIVLDTAPTGHLLRFLQLPELALEWVRTFLKLLLKYREVVTSSGVAEELISLSKGIKRTLAVFKDAGACDFTAVAIPERMSLAETADLVDGVSALGISFQRVLINNVVPEEAARHCEFCAERRAGQAEAIERFGVLFSKQASVLTVDQLAGEVVGPELLRQYWNGRTETIRHRAGRKGTGA